LIRFSRPQWVSSVAAQLDDADVLDPVVIADPIDVVENQRH
jgi:hypothetical protein